MESVDMAGFMQIIGYFTMTGFLFYLGFNLIDDVRKNLTKNKEN